MRDLAAPGRGWPVQPLREMEVRVNWSRTQVTLRNLSFMAHLRGGTQPVWEQGEGRPWTELQVDTSPVGGEVGAGGQHTAHSWE